MGLPGGERIGLSRGSSRRKKLLKAALFQKIKRKAAVWAILFLFSLLIYNAIIFSGILKLLPFASSSYHQLESTELNDFLKEALSGIALPLVPSNDIFDHAAVVVGPYGKPAA